MVPKLTIVITFRQLKIFLIICLTLLAFENAETPGSIAKLSFETGGLQTAEKIGLIKEENPVNEQDSLMELYPLKEQRGKNCLRATNYYLPDAGDSRFKRCQKSVTVHLGTKSVKLCSEFISSVRMQGSGIFHDHGRPYRLSYSGLVEPVQKEICSTAVGASNKCLIPFIHIAADPRYFDMGDLIEVPELKNARLPREDGKGDFIHPGYFIVGDTGGDIKGRNRFDFFVGRTYPLGKDNPFGPYGKKMTDESNCIMSFHRISKKTHLQKVKRLTKSIIASARGTVNPLVAARAKPLDTSRIALNLDE